MVGHNFELSKSRLLALGRDSDDSTLQITILKEIRFVGESDIITILKTTSLRNSLRFVTRLMPANLSSR